MCYSLRCNEPTMLPAGGRQHRGCIIPQAVTHSLVLLKMGKNNCPKHVELTGIINSPLLLHLVGCLYYLYFIIYIYIYFFFFYFLKNLNLFLYRMSCISYCYILVRKIFTFYINDVLLLKGTFLGPNG